MIYKEMVVEDEEILGKRESLIGLDNEENKVDLKIGG